MGESAQASELRPVDPGEVNGDRSEPRGWSHGEPTAHHNDQRSAERKGQPSISTETRCGGRRTGQSRRPPLRREHPHSAPARSSVDDTRRARFHRLCEGRYVFDV